MGSARIQLVNYATYDVVLVPAAAGVSAGLDRGWLVRSAKGPARSSRLASASAMSIPTRGLSA